MKGEREIYIRAKRPWNMIPAADAILEEIADLAVETEMICFLWGGTALGIYRDGTYLRGDADLDFGIKCDNGQRETFTKRLLDHGYTTLGQSTKRFVKNDIWIDFYFTGDLRYGEHVKYTKHLAIFWYKGRKYFIPSPIEEYLCDAYGADWKTKKTYFLERFSLPKTGEELKAYVVIGGEKEEIIVFDKSFELVELKKLPIIEDRR